MSTRPRGNRWFLLPIFFGLVGGIIAYFMLRRDDPPKAKNCLYLGIVLAIVGLALNALLGFEVGLDGDFGIGVNV